MPCNFMDQLKPFKARSILMKYERVSRRRRRLRRGDELVRLSGMTCLVWSSCSSDCSHIFSFILPDYQCVSAGQISSVTSGSVG